MALDARLNAVAGIPTVLVVTFVEGKARPSQPAIKVLPVAFIKECCKHLLGILGATPVQPVHSLLLIVVDNGFRDQPGLLHEPVAGFVILLAEDDPVFLSAQFKP